MPNRPPARSARPGFFHTRTLDEIRTLHDKCDDPARRSTFRERARVQAIRTGLTPPAWCLESRARR
jgi:hypothetical protein